LEIVYSLAATLVAYLLGSLSFAVIVSRAFGLADPRRHGSGNPGATNVLRTGNRLAAAITLLLDALKGFVPVLAVRLWGASLGLGEGTLALVALAAFLGHLYPVFFGFRGGKGVATAIGIVFAVQPLLGLATAASWAIVAFFFRYSSLASIVAALFAPVYYLFGNRVAWYVDRPVLFALFVIALLLVWRHRENINRLLAGKESKIRLGSGKS